MGDRCKRCDEASVRRGRLRRGLCRNCYASDRAQGLIGTGASPKRMAELKQMEKDGSLADHCCDLIHGIEEADDDLRWA